MGANPEITNVVKAHGDPIVLRINKLRQDLSDGKITPPGYKNHPSLFYEMIWSDALAGKMHAELTKDEKIAHVPVVHVDVNNTDDHAEVLKAAVEKHWTLLLNKISCTDTECKLTGQDVLFELARSTVDEIGC